MKTKVVFCVLVLLTITGFKGYSQEQIFLDGVYLNAAQLRDRTPAYTTSFTITTRKKSERYWAGGAEYRLESDVDSIDKKYINKNVFAYVKGDSLFMNDMNSWFSLALTKGNFIVFPTSEDAASKYMAMAGMFGLMGGMVIVPLYYSGGKANFAIISLRTGNIRAFSKTYITERLKEYPEVLEEFKKEGKKPTAEVLLKYVNLLNEKVPLGSKN